MLLFTPKFEIDIYSQMGENKKECEKNTKELSAIDLFCCFLAVLKRG